MSKLPVESLRLLVILKNDSRRLHDRIKYREVEYLRVLSLKRTRDHFKDIFKSLYFTITIDDLLLCSEDVISALDSFYTKVESMRWYLNHTEDMPATLEDNVAQFVKDISTLYDTLTIYLNAEIGVVESDEETTS
ncbi:MAG: hypothetical protein BM556_13785 [Bacteriovorax sp. MedPE-SWde]|nr:MAG: hypothetical protein BM556_13785 [Bacteriovorax sp. MedPE-SWde]